MAARPYAPAPVRTRTPVRPASPIITPVDPWEKPGDPWANAGPVFKLDPWAHVDPWTQAALDPWVSKRAGLDPWRKRDPKIRTGKSIRRVNHTIIVLPDSTRGLRRGRKMFLPVSEIEFAEEACPGDYTYAAGDVQEFGELALYSAAAAGCDCVDYDRETCTYQWLATEGPEGPGCQGEQHEFVAVSIDPDEHLLSYADCGFGYGLEEHAIWKAFKIDIMRAREQIEKNPAEVLNARSDFPWAVLELAGLTSGTLNPREQTEFILEHLDDPSLHAALLDLGAVSLCHHVESMEWMSERLEALYETDVRLVHPLEMQFMLFEPEDEKKYLELHDDYEVTSATYHSIFDGPEDGWELCTGWRELEMRKVQ